MKLRNKETGEIGNLKSFNNDKRACVWINKETDLDYIYNSLAELNEKWEDYEEPAYYYFIHDDGRIGCDAIDPYNHKSKVEERKSIGNYFETREEAEKAVEKSKAITRLKSCGFKFKGWRTVDLGADKYYFMITAESDGAGKGDLDLLFGGEE